jgi:hypothetical protein
MALLDAWLREARAKAEQVAALDRRLAVTDLEQAAIIEAGIILQLLAEIERLRAQVKGAA